MKQTILFICYLFIAPLSFGQAITLTDKNVKGRDLQVVQVNYLGKPAIRLDSIANKSRVNFDDIAIVENTNFKNGTIELEISGDRIDKNDPDHRGFVGIAFRVQGSDSLKKFECFYIRPTNGRVDDQLRRNHSVQYTSPPVHTWFKLRAEFPGVYESYADMEPGKWITMKIVVHDTKAQLYLHGASQPCLVVNDLKNGISEGPIGLKTDIGTIAHFRNLKITKEQ